jgi:hypothetical protein
MSVFSEVQQFRQIWFILLMLLVAATGWAAFVVQIIMGIPFGNNPGPDGLVWGIFIVIGIILPWFMFSLRLETTVTATHLHIRFFPLLRRTIELRDIVTVEACTYRPLAEYGGWGIRWSPANGMAYNVSGNHGVRLALRDGKKLLIGSQRAEELASTINARVSRQ